MSYRTYRNRSSKRPCSCKRPPATFARSSCFNPYLIRRSSKAQLIVDSFIVYVCKLCIIHSAIYWLLEFFMNYIYCFQEPVRSLTSQTPKKWRHKCGRNDVTNAEEMTSQMRKKWRHNRQTSLKPLDCWEHLLTVEVSHDPIQTAPPSRGWFTRVHGMFVYNM